MAQAASHVSSFVRCSAAFAAPSRSAAVPHLIAFVDDQLLQRKQFLDRQLQPPLNRRLCAKPSHSGAPLADTRQSLFANPQRNSALVCFVFAAGDSTECLTEWRLPRHRRSCGCQCTPARLQPGFCQSDAHSCAGAQRCAARRWAGTALWSAHDRTGVWCTLQLRLQSVACCALHRAPQRPSRRARW